MRVRSNAIRVSLATALVTVLAASRAMAQLLGAPHQAGIGFLPANGQNAEDMFWFHNWILLPVIICISLFVLALIVYIVWRFNETANPVPSRRTHHAGIEITWTVLPALLLVFIAVPSFRLLAEQLIIPAPDLTVKVTASQWHWNYGYPKSEGGFSFDSLYVEDKDLKPGQPRLITADHEMVVPVGKVIEFDVDLAGRHPLILGAVFRHQDRRDTWPPQQGLVQGGSRGYVLRTMLEYLWYRSRVHADQRPRPEPGGL